MSPQNAPLEITPSVTVDALLNAYPQLEDVLIDMAAPFKKLKNPLLRKSIAKVATLKHIAAVGNITLDTLIATLRQAVGQPPSPTTYAQEVYFGPEPDWFATSHIAVSIDESKLQDTDRMTLLIILEKARQVRQGEIIELITSFLPAPGIDCLKAKGYAVWTVKKDNDMIHSYFLKNAD